MPCDKFGSALCFFLNLCEENKINILSKKKQKQKTFSKVQTRRIRDRGQYQVWGRCGFAGNESVEGKNFKIQTLLRRRCAFLREVKIGGRAIPAVSGRMWNMDPDILASEGGKW